ncbi:transglutaminase domain-containing protein [Candidatus Daviesbacteria bacterium]|nr:transglutaminase domain-containing protein [Candidatus Daviesbacteria bacterium]
MLNFSQKFFTTALLLVVFLIAISSVNAQEQKFSAKYNISYDVSVDGVTEVTENIQLKNLTDKFFPSNFSLIVPGSEIFDTQASDSQGKLEMQTMKEKAGTKLIVKFTNQQIIGIGKEYSFILKFKDKGISKKLGEVWSIRVPKITQQTQVDNFSLRLSVPTSFGDPDYMSPAPAKTDESGGRIIFIFEGDPALQSGISAIFGQSLDYSFEASYSLKNNSIFPKFLSIPLMLSSNHQKTLIENISPRPENSEVDGEGNSLAFFKLNPGEMQEIKVSGHIKTYLTSLKKEFLSNVKSGYYLEENKYWTKNNPVIKDKLSEILKGKENFSSLQKAKEIDKFVSNFLRFDSSRVEKGDFLRLGSLTAINNPEKALTAEFVDLEIALLRSAGIPARQIIGFALPQGGKPFSYHNSSLHSWVEFYDSDLGWVIADPSWENTTGGAALFNFNDLTHLGLAGFSGENKFILPDKIEAKIVEKEVEEKKGAELDIKIDSEILSGFPAYAKIKITNLGNATFPESELKVDTSKILLQRKDQEPQVTILTRTPEIPPFGSIEYDLSLKTGAIWNSYQDAFQVNFAGATDTRIITVKPLLFYKIFTVEIFGALTMIMLFYVLTLLIHYRTYKKD